MNQFIKEFIEVKKQKDKYDKLYKNMSEYLKAKDINTYQEGYHIYVKSNEVPKMKTIKQILLESLYTVEELKQKKLINYTTIKSIYTSKDKPTK